MNLETAASFATKTPGGGGELHPGDPPSSRTRTCSCASSAAAIIKSMCVFCGVTAPVSPLDRALDNRRGRVKLSTEAVWGGFILNSGRGLYRI